MKNCGKIDAEVNALSDTIWDMGSRVWTFAELGFRELKSSAYEAAVLVKAGFKISDRGIGGIDTAWIATWCNGAPVLGILVEFDALPDLGNEAVPAKTPRKDGVTNGHGCGHNLIGAGAIGAAIALKNHMEKEGIPGTLKVFGCPAKVCWPAGTTWPRPAPSTGSMPACTTIPARSTLRRISTPRRRRICGSSGKAPRPIRPSPPGMAAAPFRRRSCSSTAWT